MYKDVLPFVSSPESAAQLFSRLCATFVYKNLVAAGAHCLSQIGHLVFLSVYIMYVRITILA